MSVHKISAVIITLNEQLNIERCLKSLQWADEIVIYDSGSTDSTVEIAEKLGVKVFKGPWFGFGSTKKKAAELASHDWIVSVDADEEISEGLSHEIIKTIETSSLQVAYKIPRLSYYMERWIKYGGWYPDAQLRIFNKKNYQWNEAAIHEKVEALGQAQIVQQLKNNMHHYVFKNIEHQVSTNNKYSSLQALEMHKENKSFNYFHFLTKPYVKFLECYFLKLGFLDGWAGYVIARNAAYSVYLKWIKLKEWNS